jgi:hypothetical protein
MAGIEVAIGTTGKQPEPKTLAVVAVISETIKVVST